jgi:hypothetical protein
MNAIHNKARRIVQRAVAFGKLIKPERCSRCQKLVPWRTIKPSVHYKPGYRTGHALQVHHKDYSKPLKIEWLCYHCHGLADAILLFSNIIMWFKDNKKWIGTERDKAFKRQQNNYKRYKILYRQRFVARARKQLLSVVS